MPHYPGDTRLCAAHRNGLGYLNRILGCKSHVMGKIIAYIKEERNSHKWFKYNLICRANILYYFKWKLRIY